MTATRIPQPDQERTMTYTDTTYTETDVVAAIERLSGQPLTALTPHQRDQLDQFHAGGPEAVQRILPDLRLAPGMTVLDVGSGLGGPARQVAATTGCNVLGIDIAPAYVQAARALTDAAGLADRVRFLCTDLAALGPVTFDAAYTMHVQMNVADKRSFFAEIARRLRPGARLAVFEVCRNRAAEPAAPLPWSLDGTDSFLATPEELRRTIEFGGFELVDWADETAWVRNWFEHAATRMAAAGTHATLPALLNNGPTRMMNFAAAIAADVVSIHSGSFTRARDPR
ncbi:MAG TPA: methyltransferase domain-containing protein [Mycobacteriales bacterium]|nr:methyltransferase domain-containing protein [Mycobacteriales bacterium]